MSLRKSGDLAADLRRAQNRARRLSRMVVDEVAEPAGDEVLAGARSERGTLSVSGIGASLGVDVETRGGSGRTARLTVRGTPAGAWGIVSGTRPHTIRPTGRRRAVVTPDGPRAVVSHPGTRRRDVWGASTRRAQSRVSRRVDEAAGEAVGDVLGAR